MNQRKLQAVPDRPRISERTARQQKALDEILTRQASAPHGEGTIDPATTGRYINQDVTNRTRQINVDGPTPVWRSILKKLRLMK